MSDFKITDWNKTETRLRFVAFRNDRNAFFLLTTSGDRRCLVPYLPVPKSGRFRKGYDPYPEVAPVEIQPARLLPPPCRGNAEEARNSNTATVAYVFSPWELEYGEALWPRPEEDAALLNRLERYTVAKREEYEARAKDVEALTRNDVKQILFGDSVDTKLTEERYQEHLSQERKSLESSYTSPLRPGHDFCGCLNWTLEMVKSMNVGGIRDSFLQERWAREHGFDLKQMKADKARFIDFLREHVVNATENVFNLTTRVAQQQRGLRLSNDEQEQVCAMVQFTLAFADGTRRWLAKYELRPLLDANEQREFDDCVRTEKLTAEGSSGRNVRFKQVCKDLGCKPATLRDYCQTLGIASDGITASALAQIKDYRAKKMKRPHLKAKNRTRHGHSPKPRGR
jgi:hypothetical protein